MISIFTKVSLILKKLFGKFLSNNRINEQHKGHLKIRTIDIPAAGTWARDCELMGLFDCKGFKILYHKDEDNTYWSLVCKGIIAYKVFSEEFSLAGYLIKLPTSGAFFEVLDSPWILEFGPEKDRILNKCKHYILRFYDETIEIIAQDFIFEQLKEEPSLALEESSYKKIDNYLKEEWYRLSGQMKEEPDISC